MLLIIDTNFRFRRIKRTTTTTTMTQKINLRAFSRPPFMLAAGFAIVSLIGLQLSSDVGYANDLRRQLRQLEDASNTKLISPKQRILQMDDVDNITDARFLADNNTITLEEVDEQCQFEGLLGPNEIPEDIDFINTIIVGYPGADKRMVLRQAEAMTTLTGRDSWDLKFLGLTKQPYIKTNYPHHEGIWGNLLCWCLLLLQLVSIL